MAEAIFKHKVSQLGLSDKFKLIDSFGVSGWHEGDAPDRRSSQTCIKNGVPVNHRAQQITRADFARFDYLFAMDQSHKSELLYMKPKGAEAVIELFGKWKTDEGLVTIVEDPYYSNTKSFEYNFKQLCHFTDVFLKEKFGADDWLYAGSSPAVSVAEAGGNLVPVAPAVRGSWHQVTAFVRTNQTATKTTTIMSARKLQQEFDKTNKKIAEGLSIFDDIYEKLMTTEIASQKEKFESDLKKEIKKLQRLRDQLKQWLGDSSIKLDKNMLQENRTKIEHAMDQFKDLEKLSKIKQFSNEGLELQSKRSRLKLLSGQENEKKTEACNYISDIIEQISGQSELLESDIHHFTVQLKKAKSSSAHSVQASIDDARYKVERNNEHVARLENILDNLDNDTLHPDKIDLIKDDLEYYVDNNQDEDYVEYDDFYDQLEMAAQEASSDEDDEQQPDQEEQERLEKEKAEREKAERERAERERAEREKEESKKKEKEKAKKKTVIGATPTVASPATQARTVYTNGTKTVAAVAPAPPVNAYANGTTLAEVVAGANGPTSKVAPPGLTKVVSKSSTASPVVASQALDKKAQAPQLSTQTEENGGEVSVFAESIAKLNSITHTRLSNPLPFQSISQLLENLLFNCPDSFDADKPRQYAPTNVHPSSIDYPQEPMYELNLGHLMSKFDNDTLFYCFYYSEGDYKFAKVNAARQLCQRGWVFNSETKQWFLRDAKSDEAGENYKYFDYEKTWLLRRKVNYTFAPELQETV